MAEDKPGSGSTEGGRETPSTPESKGSQDASNLKGAFDSAVKGTKAAGGMARRGWGFVKFFLPKKWTWKKALIAAIIVAVIIGFIWYMVSMFFWILKWVLIIGLLLAGMYFIFGPRPSG